MLRRTLKDSARLMQLLDAAEYAAAGEVTGSAVDMKQVRDGALLLNIGLCEDSATIGIQLTTCETSGGTYADVLAADESIDCDTYEDSHYWIECLNLKRYVKIQYTVATDSALFGIQLLGYNSYESPPD